VAVNRPGIRIKLMGDTEAAEKLIPRAFHELDILETVMAVHGIDLHSRTVRLDEDNVISCHVFGFGGGESNQFETGAIHIYSKPTVSFETKGGGFAIFVLENWRFAESWPEENDALYIPGFDYRTAMITPVFPGPHRVYNVYDIDSGMSVYIGTDYAEALGAISGYDGKVEYEYSHTYTTASALASRWNVELGYSTLQSYLDHRCGQLMQFDEIDDAAGTYKDIPVRSVYTFENNVSVNYSVYPNEGPITVYLAGTDDDFYDAWEDQYGTDPTGWADDPSLIAAPSSFDLTSKFPEICPDPPANPFPDYNDYDYSEVDYTPPSGRVYSESYTSHAGRIRNFGNFDPLRKQNWIDPSTSTPSFRIRGYGIQREVESRVRMAVRVGGALVYFIARTEETIAFRFAAETKTDNPVVKVHEPLKDRSKVVTYFYGKTITGQAVQSTDCTIATDKPILTGEDTGNRWFGMNYSEPMPFSVEPPIGGNPPLPAISDPGEMDSPYALPSIDSEMILAPGVRSSDQWFERFRPTLFSFVNFTPHSFLLPGAMYDLLCSANVLAGNDEVGNVWNRTYLNFEIANSRHYKPVYWWSKIEWALAAYGGIKFPDAFLPYVMPDYTQDFQDSKDAFYNVNLDALRTFKAVDDPAPGLRPYMNTEHNSGHYIIPGYVAVEKYFVPRLYTHEFANDVYSGYLQDIDSAYRGYRKTFVDDIAESLPVDTVYADPNYIPYSEDDIYPEYPDTVNGPEYEYMRSARIQVVKFSVGGNDLIYSFFGGPSEQSFKFDVTHNGEALDGDAILSEMVEFLKDEHGFSSDLSEWLYSGYWTARVHALFS